MKIRRLATYCIACASLLSLACSQPRIKTVEKNILLMDTFVTIRIYDADKSHDIKLERIEQAIKKMQRIEALTSMYLENSDVALLNAHAGAGYIPVSPETAAIISEAQKISQQSNGAFDITIGLLMQLWGFGGGQTQTRPEQDIIQNALKHVHFSTIQIQDDSVEIKDPDSRIDLGGIAKGYAVDVAIEELHSAGISDAQVDAGGNLRTIASSLTAGKRHVWVRHPVNKEAFYGKFPMDQGAVATSGDYERYFVQDSIRYHHILDPKTGYPARECISVTIVASSAMLCDALSTTVFVLGEEKGMEFVEKMPDVEALIIYQENGILKHKLSSGLNGKFIVLE